MNIRTINAGTMKLDGGVMFGVVPKVLWSKLVAPDAQNLTPWTMRCLLLEHDGRRILVDTGAGALLSERLAARFHLQGRNQLSAGLREAGITPGDITDVVLTHLHFDHVGGAVTRKGDAFTPAFPAATYWVHERQWRSATQPNPRERASYLPAGFMPLQESGQLRLWRDNDPTPPGMTFFVSDGHTAGQLIPVIRRHGRPLAFAADLVPSRHHVPLPYTMAYDLHVTRLMEEKQALLNMLTAEDGILFFEHDLQQTCCTLKQTDRGIRVDRCFPTLEAVPATPSRDHSGRRPARP